MYTCDLTLNGANSSELFYRC